MAREGLAQDLDKPRACGAQNKIGLNFVDIHLSQTLGGGSKCQLQGAIAGTEEKQSAMPIQNLASQLQVLSEQHERAGTEFNKNFSDVGFLGRSWDYLKNHAGTSHLGHDWYNPAALWSNLLNYDAGSKATGQRIQNIGMVLSQARQDLSRGDLAAYSTAVAQVVTIDDNGAAHIRSEKDADDYEKSQREGVELLSDACVVAVSLAVPEAPLLATISGAVTKFATKEIDGQYSAPASDLIVGGGFGAARFIGTFAGDTSGTLLRKAARTAIARPAPYLARALSTTIESGVVGASLNAATATGRALEQHEDFPSALTDVGAATTTGFRLGSAVGFGGGLLRHNLSREAWFSPTWNRSAQGETYDHALRAVADAAMGENAYSRQIQRISGTLEELGSDFLRHNIEKMLKTEDGLLTEKGNSSAKAQLG